MGETIPPVSKSQPAAAREDEDPHESVTLAPPAPRFDDLLAELEPPPLPLATSSDAHFRAALEAGTRTGLGLSELTKLLNELTGGVVGAKRANEQLVDELATLRALLGSASEQQLGLKHRIAELEQELLATRIDAERELTFVTEQHDEFLAALLDEHEEELSSLLSDGDTKRLGPEHGELAQKLVAVEEARLAAEAERERARAAMTRAQGQRDDAQARATRLERERDELRAESSMLRARLGTLRGASTTPPPPVTSSRPPSYRPPDKLRLDASELDSTLHARPRLPSLPGRLTPPPPELERAVYQPRSATPPRSSTPPPDSDPPASAFPRVDTRPGVGGPKPSEPPPPPELGSGGWGPSPSGAPPSGWTPVPPPPAVTPVTPTAPAVARLTPPPRVISVASMPPTEAHQPQLKQKPDPMTRPLIGYSLGKDNVESETLEGARLSSKPPRK
jgi:hypothetical protein